MLRGALLRYMLHIFEFVLHENKPVTCLSALRPKWLLLRFQHMACHHAMMTCHYVKCTDGHKLMVNELSKISSRPR